MVLVRESFVTTLAQDGAAAPCLHGTSLRRGRQGVSDTADGIRHNGYMDLTMIRSGVEAGHSFARWGMPASRT